MTTQNRTIKVDPEYAAAAGFETIVTKQLFKDVVMEAIYAFDMNLTEIKEELNIAYIAVEMNYTNSFRELQHIAAEHGIVVTRDQYPDLTVLVREVSAMIDGDE